MKVQEMAKKLSVKTIACDVLRAHAKRPGIIGFNKVVSGDIWRTVAFQDKITDGEETLKEFKEIHHKTLSLERKGFERKVQCTHSNSKSFNRRICFDGK